MCRWGAIRARRHDLDQRIGHLGRFDGRQPQAIGQRFALRSTRFQVDQMAHERGEIAADVPTPMPDVDPAQHDLDVPRFDQAPDLVPGFIAHGRIIGI